MSNMFRWRWNTTWFTNMFHFHNFLKTCLDTFQEHLPGPGKHDWQLTNIIHVRGACSTFIQRNYRNLVNLVSLIISSDCIRHYVGAVLCPRFHTACPVMGIRFFILRSFVSLQYKQPFNMTNQILYKWWQLDSWLVLYTHTSYVVSDAVYL